MSEANYYAERLRLGYTTPAYIERKIADLEIELDDAKYFKKDPKIIVDLESRIAALRNILATDYAQAVARGLEAPPANVVPPTIAPTSIGQSVASEPVKLWDGTILTGDDAKILVDLMNMAKSGKITKQTVMEMAVSVKSQIEKLPKNDPRLDDLYARHIIMQHVIRVAKFEKNIWDKRKRRRNPYW